MPRFALHLACAALISSFALVSCEKDEPDPPTRSGGDNPSSSTTGTWTFWAQQNLGGSISIQVNGQSHGQITQYHPNGIPCGQGNVNIQLPPGTYGWNASGPSGQSWSGTLTFQAGSCGTMRLDPGSSTPSGGGSGGGSNTCPWTYMPSCIQASAAWVNLCGNTNDIRLTFTNNCAQAMKIWYCIGRADGTWDSGLGSSIPPGQSVSGGAWTCNASGQYKFWGLPTATYNNCTGGSPNCN